MMQLEKQLRYLKIILGSYAFFIVVAASFTRFTVTVTENVKIGDVLEKERNEFVSNLFNDTNLFYEMNITREIIEEGVEEMHKRILLSMVFPIKTKTEIGIAESIQFAWHIFTTMGDARLDESKLLLTFLIGGSGMFLYIFNLLAWFTWFNEKLQQLFYRKPFQAVTVSDEEKNRFLISSRKKEEQRKMLMEGGGNDGIIDHGIGVEQRNHWLHDPYYEYNHLTEISMQRALQNHSLQKYPTFGAIFIPCVIALAFLLGTIYYLVFDYASGMEACHTGMASALTLDSPKGQAFHWWNLFLVIPVTTIANLFVFGIIFSYAQDFYVFMAKIFYQYGIEL